MLRTRRNAGVAQDRRPTKPKTRGLKALIGSGDSIALFVAPFAVVGVILNVAFPSAFGVGGPTDVLFAISTGALVVGVAIWVWSVVLVLTNIPRGRLITTGPFSLVKHPIYTSVALLVVPSVGFLVNTWLGAVLGVVMYVGTRRFAPKEEAALADTFGTAWDAYCVHVKIRWL